MPKIKFFLPSSLIHLTKLQFFALCETIIIDDKDWPTYQNLLGQMKSLDHIEQELKDLLDKLENNESDSTRILQKDKK